MKVAEVQSTEEYLTYLDNKINEAALRGLNLSEIKLIEMAEKDSKNFYQELVGEQKNAPISWSLIFLSE